MKVLVTGHTGFKGRWLSVFLEILGANVHGLSIRSDDKRIFYSLLDRNYYCDIQNFNKLKKIDISKPSVLGSIAAFEFKGMNQK